MPQWLSDAFDVVFPSDGLDVTNEMINGNPIHKDGVSTFAHQDSLAFTTSLLVRLASFSGVANRMRRGKNPIQFKLLLDFVFYPDEGAPTWQNVFQIAAMCTGIPFAFNLLSLVASTFLHTLMLLTELLPLALQNLVREKNEKGDSTFLTILEALLGGLHFIGRAITSPITGMRMALKEGPSTITKILLAVLSMAITAAVYTILFPLAVKFAIAHFPAAIAWISNALMPLIPYLQPIFTVATYMPAATWIASILGVSPVMVGLGTLLGIAATSIVNLANAGLNFILNKFFNNADLSHFHLSPIPDSYLTASFASSTY